jgi:DNA topoisomerase-3
LFIAEKPALAEVIAKARADQLGVRASKGNGSWTVGPDSVTWLFGHMYELANPGEYDESWKKWEMSTLPMIPDRWKRSAHKDKRPHLSLIKELMSKAKVVVNVGDAEREGQLLVDELLEEMGWNPFSDKTKRVWVSSFAAKDLQAALDGMFPNKDKENLSKAAMMRQRADWLHGINMTRLYTILARNSGADMLVSVGRVQSPTLKIVVDRDREIEAFKPTDHYLPSGMFRHENGSFRADWVIPDDYEGLDPSGRLIDRKVAERISAKIVGKTGKVQAFSSTNKSKQPPLPYSLSALQTDCSRKLGLTAAQTLEVAQALYERHKATTYPRSDSRYLPKSILTDEAPGIMTALASTPGLDTIAQKADLRLKSAAWNDAKVSDHHGIIPTGEFEASKLAAMSPVERKVFELIAKAFISQFYPDYTWKSLVATLSVEGETFKASGRQITAQGWKVVFGAEEDDEDEEEEAKQDLPTMSKGDGVVVEKSDITSKRTKPPAHFTDGTLIAAMTNIHRFVQDPEVKRRLKESDGIGTEATRANIIETLLHASRKFLERKGKTKIVSSAAGRSIIDVLPKEVTDPGMTAIWEAQLTKISQGEASHEQFSEILIKTLNRLVQRGKDGGGVKVAGSIEPLPGHGETCPKCGKGQMITRSFAKGDNKGKKFLACNAWKKDDPDSCRHAIWPDDDKKSNVKPMPGDGETCPKCSQGRMVTRMSRNNKRFLSCNAWKKDDPKSCNHVVWEPDETPKMPGDGQTCTKCGKGVMRTRSTKSGSRFLSCDAWKKDDPNSCNNAVWDDSKPSSGGAKKPFRIGSKPSSTAAPARSGGAATASPRRSRLGRG